MTKPQKLRVPPCKTGNMEADPKKNWETDQKERGYYYDDAHGYEVYIPDEDEENDTVDSK